MMDRSQEDKELLKDIEDLLAGREVSLPSDASDDCRTAVDFARRLVECRTEPSPAFAANLKQRLLARQSMLEAGTVHGDRKAGFWDFLGNLAPRGAVWQAAAATLLLVVMAAGILWQTGIFSPAAAPAPVKDSSQNPQVGIMSNQPAAPAAAPPQTTQAASKMLGIARASQAIAVTPDKPTYNTGEEVRLTLSFTNSNPQPMNYSNFPPSIQVVNAANGVVVRSFPAGEKALQLLPSEAKDQPVTWDQKDENGSQVAPGQYQVVVQGGAGSGAGGTAMNSNASTSIVIQPSPGK